MEPVNTPYFSIIIPVYNGLSHDLPACLDSIWNQPLDKNLYEVICVDDCSTDNTRKWLDQEAESHPNLTIIKNETNIRQGGGRNKGVKQARGKYILFIDQDDYYHPGVFLTIYNHLQKNDLEILIVDCTYQTPGKERNQLQHNFPYREIMTGDEIIEKNTIPYAPWKFIFLRSLMVDRNIFFAENERIEDVDWSHLLVHHANRVQYQPILFIHYNKSNISTTMTSYKSEETVYSTLRLARRLGEMNDTTFKDSPENVRRHLSHLEASFYYIGLRSYFFFYDKVSVKSGNIKKTAALCPSSKLRHAKRMVRMAVAHPRCFSICTNALCLVFRFMMNIYRRVKTQ